MTLNPDKRVLVFGSQPKSVYFDITTRCNKRCEVCPVRDRNIPMGDMDLGFYKSVIDQLRKDTMVYLHQSGEPLLHPDLHEMCVYAKKKGMITSLATNGLLLDELKEKLVDVLDVAWVSFMDLTAVESIEKFLRFKGMRHPVTFIKAFLVQDYKYEGRVLDYNDFNGGRELVDEWVRLTKIPDVNVKQGLGQIYDLDNPPNEKNEDPCPKLKDAPCIKWDGKVVLCCRDFFGESESGDLTKESFADVMKRHHKIYAEQQAGDFKGFCVGCNHLHRDKEVWKVVGKNDN
jgi:pyruvate-formate lyase-activating enzyme